MKHIVYRTENSITSSYYYGVHNNTNSSYLGSGIKLDDNIGKYGRCNFIRRTIKEFDVEQEAYDLEELIVDELLLTDPKCLNLALGGNGGWEGKRWYQVGKPNPMAGKPNPYKGKKIPSLTKQRQETVKRNHLKQEQIKLDKFYKNAICDAQMGIFYKSVREMARALGCSSHHCARVYKNVLR